MKTTLIDTLRSTINASGEAGVSLHDLKPLWSGYRSSVAQTCWYLVRAGEAKMRGSLKSPRYWSASIPDETVDRVWSEMEAAIQAEREANVRALKRQYHERLRRSRGMKPWADYVAERNAAKTKREQEQAAKRAIAEQARAAKRQAKEEAAKARNDRAMARAAAKEKRRAEEVNRLAAALQRRERTAEPKPEPQPQPVTVDWSRAVVTVAPRKVGRYEVLEVPGPFSATRPGQYVFEAQSCAARAAA